MKTIFFILILFSVNGAVWGQATCDLTPKQAPTIRGFRLGMTLNQVFELLPTTRTDKQVVEGLERIKAEQMPSQLTVQLNGYEFPYKTMPMFQNIQYIVLRFFREEITSITIQYNWPYWSNADEFIAKLRETLTLPEAKEWQGAQDNKNLRCKDFAMNVSAQNNGGGYLSLQDLTIAKKMDDIRQAILEKARKEFNP